MISTTHWLFLLSLCLATVAGIKYDLYQEASTWYEARDTCARDNRRLVHVTEAMEHTRIRNYRPFIFHHFWIGLKVDRGSYKWTDDTVARFTAWGEGQPGSQSECVRYSADDFTWQTHNCSDLLYFMCENDVPRPKASDGMTAATGLLVGFASMLGILLLGILLVQMPCCRSSTVKAIGHFGLGRG
ncbi:C-type lectin lectoxin-Lio3-like [Babylonia areolata]|uniref:C-type lectin lectoxin-Lio3-like n=1 Tax=Babylonia areolata TaxID=304850 RepID=UPI003FCF8BFE